MKHVLYILSFLAVFHGCRIPPSEDSIAESSYTLVSSQAEYTAGENIILQFQGKSTNTLRLWLHGSFGSATLPATIEGEQLTFSFPESFSQNSGNCTWQLADRQKTYAQGTVTILPDVDTEIRMESFLGPKSIVVGGRDFSMLVVVPTDSYDNPLPDSTQIGIHRQFQDHIENTSVQLKNGIVWNNSYSPNESGRMLISASCLKENSKEMTSIVHAANATDFTIKYHRNHSYADGNQVITFSTDILKDSFDNRVKDGTVVTFSILDSRGMRSQTLGTTVNGVAKGQLLHPDEPESWTVIAYVNGAAQSNTLSIDFEAAIADFEVFYSNDGRMVRVEHMQSFMDQLVPDGILVSLEIRNKNDNTSETLRTASRLGKASFVLSKDFYPDNEYELTIRAAGISKTKTVLLR